jgi:CHAD domain-containing protein
MASVRPAKQKATTFIVGADAAQAAIAKHYTKMMGHQGKVLADQNPEEVHQMRVAIRRLRSAIVAFTPIIKLPKYATDQRLQQAAQTLGQLRDLDVLHGALQVTYLPHLPPEEVKVMEGGLKQWRRDRKQSLKAVKQLLKSSRWHNTHTAFAQWLKHPQFQPIAHSKLSVILPDLLLPDLSRLLTHGAWWLDLSEPEGLTTKQWALLHSLRKQAKRSRYNLELFKDCYPESYIKALNRMKSLQTVLGELQDAAVMEKFLTTIMDQELTIAVPTLLKQLRHHEHSQWPPLLKLQRYFLRPRDRANLREMVCHPLLS